MNAADVALVEALAAEAEEIAALAQRTYADAFGADFPPGELERYLDAHLSAERWRCYLARDQVLVAKAGEQAVGFVQFGAAEVAGDVEVKRLYVSQAWQGRGLGSRLLRAALAHPVGLAADAVWIAVWETNFGAQHLYGRFGFAPTGQRRAFVLPSGEVAGYDLLLVRTNRKGRE